MTVVARLREARLLAILRMDSEDGALVETAAALYDTGVRALECTLNRRGAIDAVAALAAMYGDDTLVGAGTVTTTDQVDELLAVGAHFCVTPHLDPDLLIHALAGGLPMIPGIMTPSELAAALRLGAPAVKLFPAGPLGVGYLSALRGPFGDFPVIPTGGIDVPDVTAWLDAGAICVGLGSALTGPAGVPPELAELLAR